MQSKFTLKNFGKTMRIVFFAIYLLVSGLSNAQTVSTASGINYLGNFSINNPGPLVQTFVIENTNATARVLTAIDMQMAPFFTAAPGGGPSAITLYYSSASLSGPVTAIGVPGWIQIATGNVTVPVAPAIMPVLTGISFVIPPATQYRFAVVASKGMVFSFNPIPTPNIFTNGGINLKVGDNQIAGQTIGYAGVFPALPVANTPTFFGGSITLVPAVPCSGAPAPGATQSTATTVCPQVPFTLSTSIAAGITGLTYQWQISPDSGISWTNAAGASTNSTYSTSQSVANSYRCMVSCGPNNRSSSSQLQVTMNPIANCYCTPGNTNCSFKDEILNVKLGTLNNSSSGCSGSGYTYYSVITAPAIYSGAGNPMSVTIGAGGDEFVSVWIDYNQNGVFDESEFFDFGNGRGGILNNTINVPATALSGVTRMRVRVRFSAGFTSGQACTGGTFAETEDYNVNIEPCVPGAITAAPQNASTQCSGNTSFGVMATGTLLSYSWQYRVNSASPWLAVPDAAPFSGGNTSTLLLHDVPTTMNGYQFRATVQGGCSAIDFSSPATLTVTSLVATVSPASASVCLGGIQQLTLTNPASVPFYRSPSNLPLTIADNSSNGNTSTINVSGIPPGAVVTNVSVTFSMTHTWVGDLVMNLKAPNGQVLNLIGQLNNGSGNNSSDDFLNTTISSTGIASLSSAAAPRSGIFKADVFHPIPIPTLAPTTTNSWTLLLGTLNGDWGLVTCDLGPGDFGVLTNWAINITYMAPPVQGLWMASPSLNNSMFTDSAATTAYIAGTPVNTIWVKPGVNTDYSVIYSTPTPCVSMPTIIPVSVFTPVSNLVNPINNAACTDGAASFSVKAAGGPISYQWQVSTDGGLNYSNIPGAAAASLDLTGITLSMNGNLYRCILNAAPCAGATISAAAALLINKPPVVTLSSPDLLLTPGEVTSVTASSSPAAAAAGWAWTYNGVAIANNSSNTVSGITIDGTGTYIATVTDINGCAASSAGIVVGNKASDRLWIYPNPTKGAFQVRLYHGPGSISERGAIYIYNSRGQLVTSREFEPGNTTAPYQRIDFDLGRAATGTYIVKAVHKYSGKIVSGLVVIE